MENAAESRPTGVAASSRQFWLLGWPGGSAEVAVDQSEEEEEEVLALLTLNELLLLPRTSAPQHRLRCSRAFSLAAGEGFLLRRFLSTLNDTGPGLCRRRIACAACASIGSFLVFSDDCGNLWYFGPAATATATATDATDGSVQLVAVRMGLGKVDQLACGDGHALVLVRDGEGPGGRLFSFGDSNAGQLGWRDEASAAPISLRLGEVRFPDPAARVTQICAAGQASLALVGPQGQLFVWGSPAYGRLGLGDDDDVDPLGPAVATPRLQTALVGVGYGWLPDPSGCRSPQPDLVAIAAGVWHGLALASNGDVYAWGWNRFEQIGQTPDKQIVLAPRRMVELDSFTDTPVHDENDDAIVAIAAGARFSAFQTRSGCVIAMGELGTHSPLELPLPPFSGAEVHARRSPRVLPMPKPTHRMVPGHWGLLLETTITITATTVTSAAN